jgi:hypothetical protein
LAEEYEGKVTFAGVSNNDSVEDGKGYVEEFKVPYPMAHSPETWDAFDVPYQPVTIVIDANGGIVDRFDGPIAYKDLKASIEAVL